MNYAVQRQALEQRRDALLAPHRRRHGQAPLPTDFAEQATALETLDVLFALDHDSRRELCRIHQALRRMAQGDYGLCSHCGASIEHACLMARPETDLCLRCSLADGR